jgi:hypothetical protein
LTPLRVYVDGELAAKIRKAARVGETSVSAFLGDLVQAGMGGPKPAPDRATVVLEYQSIQLDLLLKHANPDLPKLAKQLFRSKTGGEPDAL